MRKKSLLLVLAVMLVSMFTLVACGDKTDLKVNFTQAEIVVSQDEPIDFFQYLNLGEIKKSEVDFTVADSNFIQKTEEGYKTLNLGGQTTVFATRQGKVLSQTKLIVKHKFSTPDNFVVDEMGVLHWEESFVYNGSLVQFADSYIIEIDGREVSVSENSYLIGEQGVYQVRIKAEGMESSYIDPSEYSDIKDVYYQVVPSVENINFLPNENFGTCDGVVSWSATSYQGAAARYNVYLGGIKILNNSEDTSVRIDLSNFKAGQKSELIVEAFVDDLNILSSKASFLVTKFEQPTISYDNGLLIWPDVENASEYVISYVNKNSSEIFGTLRETNNFTILQGVESGIYEVKIQTLGTSKENTIYVSSEISVFECAKLENPEISYAVESGRVILNFSDDEYIKNYTIQYADKIIHYDITSGLTTSIDMSELDAGVYDFRVFANPFIENGLVKPWGNESEQSSNVLNADAKEFTIYKLTRMGQVLHVLDEEGNSILSFESIENADTYSVTLGEEKTVFENVQPVFNKETDRYEVSLNLGNLSLKKYQVYDLEIEAYRADGNAIAVKENKKLEVLSKVSPESKENQENGYFKWQSVNENAKYYYEIYKLNQIYELGSEELKNAIIGVNPITGETTENIISNQIEEFGYYYIKIYTRLKENNLIDRYLDSDFNDENGYFETIFVVQDKLSAPKITFTHSEDNQSYSLSIPYVDYSNRYFITITHNGKSTENVLYNSSGADRTFTFAENQFDNEGVYEISVVASAGESKPDTSGNQFIDILHPNSEAAIINVEKLAKPEYNVDESLQLTVEMVEHAGEVIILKDGNQVNDKNSKTLDLSSINGTLYFQFKAQDDDVSDNNYYLDSNTMKCTFVRAKRPTNLVYSKGVLKYECLDEKYIDFYQVEITLVNPNNPNYTIMADVDKNEEFKLQQFILDEIKENEEFKTEYEQWSRLKNGVIEIKVVAYKLSVVEGYQLSDNESKGGDIFLMPSLPATTSGGEEKLSLVKLEAPKILDYDASRRVLTWEAVGEATGTTTYDILVDGEKVEANILGTTYDFNLKDIQFDTAKVVTVVAYNDSYLSFASSNPITIKRLDSVNNIYVNQNGDVHFTISLVGVRQVECNGEVVSLNSSTGYVSFNLKDFETEGRANIAVGVIAQKNEKEMYFENSQITNFEFENISNKTIESTNKGGLLSWSDVTSEFNGVDLNPVTYTITIYKNPPTIISGISENRYALNSNELASLAIGNYELDVQVVIADYELGGDNAKGYYGSLTSDKFNVEKLKQVEESEISMTLKEDLSLRLTQRKVNAEVVLSWPNIWQEGISFDVIINERALSKLKAGTIGNDYRLELNEEGRYVLTLSQSGYFNAKNNEFKITVNADNAISSNQTTKIITKYQTVSGATVNENGVLTIEGESGEFAVSIICNDRVTDREILGNSVDILDLLKECKGRYNFEVVRIDSKNIALPSQGIFAGSGYRLEGLSGLEIKQTGDVEIALFNESEIDENIVFVAEYQGEVKEFLPKRKGESAVFNYSLADFVKLFNIDSDKDSILIKISVRKTGCVNSEWKEIEFKFSSQESGIIYARGRNYNDDYIKVSNLAGEETSAIRFKISLSGQGQLNAIERTYLASELEGYWVTTAEGEYFVKEKPDDTEGEVCFGMSLNSLLSEIDYGEVNITISRVTLTDNVYIQYNDITIPRIVKLKRVEDVALRDGVLTWKNTTETEATGYYVYFYIQNGDKLQEAFYENVTTAFIDLKTFTKLQAGTEYYACVVTVSNTEGFVGSKETQTIKVMKYRTPSKIQILDGKIVFDDDSIKNSDFLTAISSNYGKANFLSVMATTTFTSLFHFSATSLNSAIIKLKFTDSRSNDYYATVNAYDILPNLNQYSFKLDNDMEKKYLDAIEDQISGGSDQSEFRRNLQAMLDILKSVNGIATNDILFDDFGRSIPSGEYTISVCQTGLDAIGTITSDYSAGCFASVIEAPMIKFGTETINNKTNYIVSFNRVKMVPAKGENAVYANNYLLYMISKNGEEKHFFEIENIGNGDQINYVLKIKVDGSIKEIPLAYDESKDVLILNVTSALLPLLKSDGSRLISRESYNFTIYAKGGEYAINGKTDMKTLSLLDIKSENIKLDKGYLSWSVDKDFNAPATRVTIKKAGNRADFIDVPFVNNKAVLDLSVAGEYEYIILSILGGYSNLSMSVDSDSYMIKNIYKLNDISVSVKDNHFTIIENEKDLNLGGDYQIYNNIDGIGAAIVQPDKEYWANNYEATKYYFTKLGSTGEFTQMPISEEDINKGADYLLGVESLSKIVLASETIVQDVIFLNKVDNIGIINGDLIWALSEEREINLPEGAEVIFEVKAMVKNGDTFETRQTLYTSNCRIDTLLFTELPDEGTFKFTIQALGYMLSEANGDITTVEGKHYLKAEIKVEKIAILAGKESEIEGLKRSSMPTNVSINKGELDYTLDEKLTCGFRDGNGNEVNLEELTYNDGNYYNLFIYSYNTNNNDKEIKSKRQQITFGNEKRIYKLPKVESEDFVLVPRGAMVEIDLSNLYNNKQILGSNDYYKVLLTVVVDNVEYKAYSYNNGNKNFVLYFTSSKDKYGVTGQTITLPSEYRELKLKFQVCDNQDTQYIMLLNSEETEMDISPMVWGENAEVIWNDDKKQFEWDFEGNSEEKTFLYEVKVFYNDSRVEEDEVSTNFYQPRGLGVITGISIRVRENANSIYSIEALSGDFNNGIELYLFAGGNGTKQNPYRIKTQQQFENIKYRNREDLKYYFVQIDNIVMNINGFGLNEPFYGEYDGNYNGNKRLTLNLSPISDEAIVRKLVTSANYDTEVTFKNFTALFKEIGLGGEVKNLDIALNFQGLSLKESTLFAGIAKTNYGRVDNIEISSISSNYSMASDAKSDAIAQASLVGINYGVINNSKNNADIAMRVTSNISTAKIIAGGLVIFNEKEGTSNARGLISNSFNKGNFIITNTKSGGMIWASGIAINNTGEITRCGNDGNIETVNTSQRAYSNYLSGISVKSENAILSYCYNNGALTVGKSGNTNFIGGIAFIVKAGRISGLVDATEKALNIKIINTCLDNIRQGDVSYASNGIASITTNPLSEVEFECGENKLMKISLVGDKYQASII